MARLLLVDDEKMAQTVYGEYLTQAGHEVTVVGSVLDAKAALEKGPFDAVVTDLILPESDGMEVLRLTKERYPGTEVVVITALDKVDPAVRAIKSGAAEYLIKPVSPEVLQHALSRALTTRALLRENAELRRHVALVEAGQRLVAMLDRGRLLDAAAESFTLLGHAEGTLVFAKKGDAFELASHHRVEPDSINDIVTRLRPRLDATASHFEVVGLPAPYFRALVFPATDSGTTWGFAVLLYRELPPEGVLGNASYLAQHLGLALYHVGRYAAVEDLAYVDDLTHLHNARYLDLVIGREVAAARESNGAFSLLFLDLDYFKNVNDTHGHLIGSKLLVEVARIIKSCTRDLDVVARYGGDEYVVLLHETDSGGALKVAERIRRAVEQHHFLAREGMGLTITTCIGIASFPEHAQDKDTLLDLADRAMYRGKKNSRNVIYMAAMDLEATPAARHRNEDPRR